MKIFRKRNLNQRGQWILKKFKEYKRSTNKQEFSELLREDIQKRRILRVLIEPKISILVYFLTVASISILMIDLLIGSIMLILTLALILSRC